MIKNFSSYLLFLFSGIIFLLISCQEDYQLEDVQYIPKIVIEGLVSNNPPPHYISVSLSNPLYDSIIPIDNAVVWLSDNEGNAEQLVLDQPGIYRSDTIIGREWNTYNLKVYYKEELYEATSELLPVTQIDSLIAIHKKSPAGDEEGYHVLIYAQNTFEDTIGYYRVTTTLSDSLFNNYNDLLFFDDDYTSSISGLYLPYFFNPDDTVTIHLYSLTYHMYLYFLMLDESIRNKTNSYHMNPPSNISNGALGFFQASSVSSTKIVISE